MHKKHHAYPAASRLNRDGAGYTLTEVLVVIPLVLIPLAMVLPVGIRFYQTQTVDDTALNLINTIKRSQTYGSFQKNDSSFGVKINNGAYVLFRGDTYANRFPVDDEIFTLPTGVFISGLQEIVFAKLSGLPSVNGTLTVNMGTVSREITINEKGIIE